MSVVTMTKIKTLLAALSTTVLFTAVTGCATGPDDPTSDDEAMPTVAEDNVDTESTGQTCECPAGKEYQAGLCYPTCNSGYHGVGPVCWATCASGFTDTGAFCHRDTSIVSASTSHCPWYDKCGVGLKKGCSTCPSGYSNDGCTCRRDAYIYAKPSYGRGAGTTPSCTTH
jgi:hypothetical protein